MHSRRIIIKQKINILLDILRYRIVNLNFKLKENKFDILNVQKNKKTLVLCTGHSVHKFKEDFSKYDLCILINFKNQFKFDSLMQKKLRKMPSIILSSNDEHILNHKNRKILNLIAVYSRVAQKDISSIRVRRRLEAYGMKVKGLFEIIDEKIVDKQLRNTGLTGIYLASIFSKQITIYGLDFYSMPYFDGSQINESHLNIKRGLNKKEFGDLLVNKFIDICLNFSEIDFHLNTYFDLSKIKCPKNLSINRLV